MSDTPYKNAPAKKASISRVRPPSFTMGDTPSELLEKWQGYFRYTDPTILPANVLTFPSINCFIPNKDKIEPRLGSTLLGQAFTTDKSWPIIGHKKRFTTMGGADVEVRVTKSDDTNKKDIIEVLYPNPVTGALQWYQITENTNPLAAGLHRYYFDDWFDTNLNPALSLNLTRLIWVNGLKKIFSWTGGIAPIVSIVANTSITTTTGVTWASLGFVDPALGGSGNIVINGLAYAITGGWATDTLTLTNTTGISVNDLAFAQIQQDDPTTDNTTPLDVAFDVCRNNKGYMFYGNWKSRKLFMSNQFGHSATQEITSSQAVQNDLVVDQSIPYTGTGSHVYRITIDAVNPNINTQTFSGSGLNDAVYDTTTYNGTLGVLNEYKVLILGDFTANFTVASSAHYTLGEIVQGATAGDLAQVVTTYPSGAGDTVLGLKIFSGTFAAGNTITGSSSGALGTVATAYYQNYFQYTKNGTIVNLDIGAGSRPINQVITNSITLIDNLSIKFASFFGHTVGDVFALSIRQGGADTFHWQNDGGTASAPIAITTANQLIELGLTISFTSKTGHAIGDFWNITVDQKVTKAWTNFYYTLPIRKPGEGYIYQLPSNFWTMAPQEEQMYVNTQYGYWSYVSTVLSADLQSESVSLTPLKQASSSKVIFPYMIGYLDNDLIYVTENKTLDTIGRQELIQLPQVGNLSQPVALDFQDCTFEDGSMEYLEKRLYITSPKQNIMLCYDNQPLNKYWQPPQVIPENGILSIVGNTLISHSNIRNQTFNLFTGTSGDNGSNYTVRARSAYMTGVSRWVWKQANATFSEGYISGAPPIKQKVYLGVNGCGGIYEHLVQPVVCITKNRAPLGSGALSSHQLGSDRFSPNNHFNEMYQQYKPILKYRFVSLELECIATNHSYSWLSMGINEITGNFGNNDLKNRAPISKK
jgi:hypothetical protein